MLEAALYKKQIIIFLDLLGIKAFIKKYEKNDQKRVLNLYQGLLSLIEFEFSQHLSEDNFYPLNIDLKKITQQHFVISGLSDSVIITIDYEKLELFPFWLRLVCLAQISFIAKEVPIRGYITVGKCYHDSAKGLIFGSGLIDAYEGEQGIARFPRVVIDDAIVHRLRTIYDDKKKFDQMVKRYERQYPSMKGLEALFLLARQNVLSGIGKDKGDGLYCTRFDQKDVIEIHQSRLISAEGKSLKDLLDYNVKYYAELYAKSKDNKHRKIYENWSYLQTYLKSALPNVRPR